MSKFKIGRGTTVSIALLPLGESYEPNDLTLTTESTDTAKGVTTITLSAAVAAGKSILAKNYLGFRSPTGKEVLVQLNADVAAADTDLTVVETPAIIAAGSIAQFPLKISNRTEANLDRKAGVAEETTFDDDAWKTGISIDKMADIALPGSWNPLDPAYKTLEYAYNNGLNIYLWLKTLAPNADYATGTIFKGEYIIEGLPVGIGAAAIIKGDITLKSTGKITQVDPVPTT